MSVCLSARCMYVLHFKISKNHFIYDSPYSQLVFSMSQVYKSQRKMNPINRWLKSETNNSLDALNRIM